MIQQIHTLKQKFIKFGKGVYHSKFDPIVDEKYKINEFWELSQTKKYEPPKAKNPEQLEELFWKSIEKNTEKIYGTDQEGSLVDSDTWNLRTLGTILDKLRKNMPGINR